ncbi:MAG: Ldh family oxidoreductase [Methanomassiliicoccus sp.]|nr:Ldh family oxidoreductase [Methanomassiliicoccus sp.]
MKISINELKDLTTKAIASFGYDEEETVAIREILLYAQLRGNNQGVVKLIGKGIPRDPAAREIVIEKETPLSARINGNRNHAMVVVRKAMEIVAAKAETSGFGIAGTFNTNTSSGAIGYVASELARRGFVSFVFSRSPERVAMHGSYEPVFGTNPLAIGIPTGNDPIVLDMSTAATSYFGLVEAVTAGRDIPGDIAYDASGQPTTSPAEAIKGAIRSFDRGYKGSGLAMIGEILAGPLVGAAFCGLGDSKGNWGHLIYAIDPDLLGDRDEFLANVKQVMGRVRSTRRLPGVDEIMVPGERGSRTARECLERGEIEIEDNLLAELRKVAERA